MLQKTSYRVSVLGTLQALELSRLRDDFQYTRRVLQPLQVDFDAISWDVHQLQQEGSATMAGGGVQEACVQDVSY